ncbi:immunity 22 family protein [Neptunomonas qingdaonensis]|uniref:Immunity protein 22 n=1 Tax=Neptunomonas qingdaonensis TaxID=1045558 RepID=A0A1I2Q323_9GAMM|nr:immunity 22 family protein [Neptunomonas qingdaonensis]SFG22698.1 Immunity protein 22 [Neptunomonas qingdaonensis]
MTDKQARKSQSKTDKGYDFTKKYKVSVWASQHPYADVPDDYFDETFSKNNSRAVNTWSRNFNLNYFRPENLETNGTEEGLVNIEVAAGECSFSTSYIQTLLSKAKKKKLEEVSWIILLFEVEYSLKISGVGKDQYMTFLGAFDYDDGAENVYDVEDPQLEEADVDSADPDDVSK